MKKIGFKVSMEWEKAVGELSEAEAGQLLKWMFAYTKGHSNELPDDPRLRPLAALFAVKFDARRAANAEEGK